MSLKWNYENSVLVLPASVLSADATPEQLRVLLWLASDASLAEKPTQLARLAGCSAGELTAALSFWQTSGVISDVESKPAGEKKTPTEKKPTAQKAEKRPADPAAQKPKVLQRADELPTYTSSELADMLEKNAALKVLLDESQQIFGKIFNMHEVNILFGMVDYLNLDSEYILLLLAHCKRIEIKSLRAAEKYAITLIDSGVADVTALEARVQVLEAKYSLEGRLRAMFGINARALTAKEKKHVEAWMGYGYGEEIIRMAYEITVNTIGKPSIPYAASILERWYTEGLRSAEDIKARIAAEQDAKSGKTTLGHSFNPDDFLEAAIERNFRLGEADQKGGN